MSKRLFLFILPFIIIQPFSVFATVSTTTESVTPDIVPSTSYTSTKSTATVAASVVWSGYSGYDGQTYSGATAESACASYISGASMNGDSSRSVYNSDSNYYCYARSPQGGSWALQLYRSYVCSSGTLSGTSCLGVDTYTCPQGGTLTSDKLSCVTEASATCKSGYTLSSDGLSCTKQTTTDSCESLKGQTYDAWSTVDSTASVCVDTCVAEFSSATYGDASVSQLARYRYTGVSCSDSTTYGTTQTAEQAKTLNDAALLAAQEKQEKEQCGSAGYDIGTSNGKTVIACKVADSKTTTTSTTTNTDGSTSTTTNTTTITGATGTTCTYDSSTYDVSCTAGTSGTSTTTSKTTGSSSSTTANGDGSTTTTDTTTEEGDGVTASTDASDFDYKDTKRETRTMSDIFSSHYDDLKSTQLYSSVSGFFNLSISSGSCSVWVFPFFDASISFDPCTFIEYLCGVMKIAVLIVCSMFAFRIAVE